MISSLLVVGGFLGAFIFFYSALNRAEKKGKEKAVSDLSSRQAEMAAKISYQSQKKQAEIESKYANTKLPDSWPTSGLVLLTKENSFDPSVTTSADMQLDRG